MKSSRYIGHYKRAYLILEKAITDFENHLSLIAFLNFHPMINISKIKLSKTLSPAKNYSTKGKRYLFLIIKLLKSQ